jgi:acyl-coenzyme A thioesterase PaaI-like protein
MNSLQSKLGDRAEEFLIPPPVFLMMEGEFVDFSEDEGWLETRFPIKPSYRNPYHTMQGGMIAAAIDNTLGPLSMLVAPPNVTRTLEVKYSKPIRLEMGTIVIRGRLLKRDDRELWFSVDVRTEEGGLLARAKARHWILEA